MLRRENDELYVDDVALSAIAEAFGTPTYVYSEGIVESRFGQLADALGSYPHSICYAVKANSNLAILKVMNRLGTGFDIVSGGELERVLLAGANPQDIVFSGVGKSTEDIDFALKVGIRCFNVESKAELERIEARAQLLSRIASISVRVNPDIDAMTHPYISTGLKENKFGVPETDAISMYRHAQASERLDVRGIDCHIGSQITELEPYVEARDRLLKIIDTLANEGIVLEHFDLGGGFGVNYNDEPTFDIEGFGRKVAAPIAARGLELVIEPGRYLVADAGVLLSKVEYLKRAPSPDYKNFAVVDAAMNDLIRPALYGARHPIETVSAATGEPVVWDIVGPVCESGDFLATERELALNHNSLIAIFGVGAYGMAMSSNYNGRGRPAEVLVQGSTFRLVRKRETIGNQLDLEINI